MAGNPFDRFLTKKYIEHEVDLGGEKKETFRFYPISIRRFARLQDAVKVFTKSIAVLMSGSFSGKGIYSDPNMKHISRSFGVDGEGGSEMITEPADAEVIEVRQRHRDRAIEDVVTVLMHEDNLKATCELVMDSMRDTFASDDSVDDFLDRIDMEILPQMLEGLAKANKKVFDPLVRRLGIDMGKVGTVLKEKLDSELRRPQQGDGSSQDSEEGPTLRPIPADDPERSETATSPSLQEA